VGAAAHFEFAGLSKAWLQDARLNRLSLLANARRSAREVADEIFSLKAELHEIYCELHGLKNVIPLSA
jgi:hypothetical protein